MSVVLTPSSIFPCSCEQADWRMIFDNHLLPLVAEDSDVIIPLILLCLQSPTEQLSMVFGTGKHLERFPNLLWNPAQIGSS